MAYIKVLGTGLIKLTGSYGYDTSTVDGLAAYTTIDASDASWIVSNSANQNPDDDTSYLEGSGIINRFPFIVYSAGYGLTLKGGTIWGEVPQTSDWQYTYNDSAALRIEEAPGVTVDGWRIDKAWDAIRIHNGSDNFLINDVHLSNIRDDAIENEWVLSGSIRDSLFDGVFGGISLGNGDNHDGSGHTVMLQNTFIRMEAYLANGEMTHGSPFKANTDAPGTSPDIRIINSVIAIEDPTHNGFARLKLAWENVVESRGNIFLNLSDTPLPSNYPKPPAGFIILQGQAARDYWEKVEAAWRNNHDGQGDVEMTPLPAISGQGPVLELSPVLPSSGDFNGDGRSDILWRHDNGTITNWLGQANGGFVGNAVNASINVSNAWQVDGVGDFNGDGRDDILWRNADGTVTDWLGQADGGFVGNKVNIFNDVADDLHVEGVGDFNGDGRDDVLWRNDNGIVTNWLGTAKGGFVGNNANLHLDVSDAYHIQGVGDFNGDGRDDVLWRSNDGLVTNWLGTAKGGFVSNKANLHLDVADDWQIAGIGDFNGDGRDDVLWRNTDGFVTNWLGTAKGGFVSNKANLLIDVSDALHIEGIGDHNGDGRDDILWRHDDGTVTNWLGQADGDFHSNSAANYDVSASWQIQGPDLV